jgi:hypothetical protein
MKNPPMRFASAGYEISELAIGSKKSAQNAPLTRSPRDDDGDDGDGAEQTAWIENREKIASCQAVYRFWIKIARHEENTGGRFDWRVIVLAKEVMGKQCMSEIAVQLRQLEQQLLDPIFRRDREAVSRLLADEFIEFGNSGRTFDKERILNALASEMAHAVSMSGFDSRILASGVALVTYRALHWGPAAALNAASLRSSVWVWRDGRWQMVFHQGTRSPME